MLVGVVVAVGVGVSVGVAVCVGVGVFVGVAVGRGVLVDVGVGVALVSAMSAFTGPEGGGLSSCAIISKIRSGLSSAKRGGSES